MADADTNYLNYMAMKKIHVILLLALGLGVSSCFTSYISN